MTKNSQIRVLILGATCIAMGMFVGYFANIDSLVWLMLAGVVGALSWSLVRFLSTKLVMCSFGLSAVLAAGALMGSSHWVYVVTASLLVIANGAMATHFLREIAH